MPSSLSCEPDARLDDADLVDFVPQGVADQRVPARPVDEVDLQLDRVLGGTIGGRAGLPVAIGSAVSMMAQPTIGRMTTASSHAARARPFGDSSRRYAAFLMNASVLGGKRGDWMKRKGPAYSPESPDVSTDS